MNLLFGQAALPPAYGLATASCAQFNIDPMLYRVRPKPPAGFIQPCLPTPHSKHLALRRRMARAKAPDGPHLTLQLRGLPHLLHDSRSELASPRRMLPPKPASPLRAARRGTLLLAKARRPVWVARIRNQTAPLASSTSRGVERAGKHDNQRTEGQSAGNPSTGYGAGPGRVGPIAQPLTSQMATEIGMQIAR